MSTNMKALICVRASFSSVHHNWCKRDAEPCVTKPQITRDAWVPCLVDMHLSISLSERDIKVCSSRCTSCARLHAAISSTDARGQTSAVLLREVSHYVFP